MSGASVPVAALRELAGQLFRECMGIGAPELSNAADRILRLTDVAEARAAHAIDPLEHLRATVREVDQLGGLDCCCTAGCKTPRCAAVARLRGLV